MLRPYTPQDSLWILAMYLYKMAISVPNICAGVRDLETFEEIRQIEVARTAL